MRAGCRVLPWALVVGACAHAPDGPLFFDDFHQADLATLQRDGWRVRERAGHPGVEGASWGPAGIELGETDGERVMRLVARTDGTPQGTQQAQLCHERKVLRGTYAARVRFSDAPVEGPNGDVVVQTFYAVSPLRFDFDPEYSEIDWEYLPNGGWGDTRRRLYAVSWQTVRLSPWQAHNAPTEGFASYAGWRELVMQVSAHEVRWFVDGQPFATHGGRNVPAVPMAIQFNQWFSPGALNAGVGPRRVWQQEVDWVFHVPGRLLSPAEVRAQVQRLRSAGTARVDTVPPAEPPLPSTCDF